MSDFDGDIVKNGFEISKRIVYRNAEQKSD